MSSGEYPYVSASGVRIRAKRRSQDSYNEYAPMRSSRKCATSSYGPSNGVHSSDGVCL